MPKSPFHIYLAWDECRVTPLDFGSYFHSGFSLSCAAALFPTALLSHTGIRGDSVSPLGEFNSPAAVLLLCDFWCLCNQNPLSVSAWADLFGDYVGLVSQPVLCSTGTTQMCSGIWHMAAASFLHARHLPSSQHIWTQPWIASKFCWSANIPASKYVCWNTCETPAWEDVDEATQKSLVFTGSTWASSALAATVALGALIAQRGEGRLWAASRAEGAVWGTKIPCRGRGKHSPPHPLLGWSLHQKFSFDHSYSAPWRKVPRSPWNVSSQFYDHQHFPSVLLWSLLRLLFITVNSNNGKPLFLGLPFLLLGHSLLIAASHRSDNVLTGLTTSTKCCNCNCSSQALKGHKPTSLHSPVELGLGFPADDPPAIWQPALLQPPEGSDLANPTAA